MTMPRREILQAMTAAGVGVGAGGLGPRRPDRGYNPPLTGQQAGSATNQIRVRQLVIYGTGVTGWFEYSGTPLFGNPPLAWAAPPGVTKDPFGNVLPTSTGGVVTSSYSGGSPVQVGQLLAGQLNLWGGPPSGYTTPGQVAVFNTSPNAISLASPASAGAPSTGVLSITSGAPGVTAVMRSIQPLWIQYSVAAQNQAGSGPETYNQINPSLAGWTNPFHYMKLPLGEISGGFLTGPNPSLIFYNWRFSIANGTVLTPGNIIFAAGILPAGYYYASDNTQLSAVMTGGGAGAPTDPPLTMTAFGSLHYSGPAFTLTAAGFIYGQAIISTGV